MEETDRSGSGCVSCFRSELRTGVVCCVPTLRLQSQDFPRFSFKCQVGAGNWTKKNGCDGANTDKSAAGKYNGAVAGRLSEGVDEATPVGRRELTENILMNLGRVAH